MKYYEIEFSDGNEETAVWVCIKGVRQPSIAEASEFCKRDAERYRLPVRGVYPIDEMTARSCYDFSGEERWPVFGDMTDTCHGGTTAERK